MITKPEIWKLKAAQREAGLGEVEYREALALVAGCASSKDAGMTSVHVDSLLKYFEAVFWAKVDRGELPAPEKPTSVFRARDFWRLRNPAEGASSRQRYAAPGVEMKIRDAEARLAEEGKGPAYARAIERRVCNGRDHPDMRRRYLAALERTLAARVVCPF